METRQPPAQLEHEFKERAQWYCKGFGGALLQSFTNSLEIFSVDPRDPVAINGIRKSLKWMEDLYDCVEEFKLKENPDAPLLLSIKREIATIHRLAEVILGGGNSYEEAYRSVWRIDRWGQIYRARLTALRDKIRENDGWEGFNLRTTDLFEEFWSNALGG